MLKQFQSTFSKNFPDAISQKIAVAASGGLDSMVLLDLLVKSGFEITLLHCNFNLRDTESDTDAAFITSFAAENKLLICLQSFDTKKFASDYKLSIQMAARKLRYDWFEEKISELKINFLATAHHADDNLETILINFSRGTGLDGLTGIPIENGKIIRPLLAFSRKDILAYAKENKIQWREDSSNASTKYQRNKLRHEVIPILKEANPQILDSIQDTIQNLKQIQSLVADASRIIYRDVVQESFAGFIITLDRFLELPNFQAYLYQWLQPFGFTAWEDIYELPKAQSGKQVFSATHALTKNRNELILSKIESKPKSEEVYLISNVNQIVNFPLNLKMQRINTISNPDSSSIFVDENKIQFPLLLRRYKEGDYFYPFGMTGKKKLSKYFKDEKISVLDKKNIWLLCSDSQIVWVINHRLDNRFSVNANTTNILKIITIE
ncbi:MAG: tRNA(Ile)-lysidine synthase [Flavobacterium sp.]